MRQRFGIAQALLGAYCARAQDLAARGDIMLAGQGSDDELIY